MSLWGITFLHESVLLFAGPCKEITAGLQRGVPGVSKEVVIAMLQLETQLALLLYSGEIDIES